MLTHLLKKKSLGALGAIARGPRTSSFLTRVTLSSRVPPRDDDTPFQILESPRDESFLAMTPRLAKDEQALCCPCQVRPTGAYPCSVGWEYREGRRKTQRLSAMIHFHFLVLRRASKSILHCRFSLRIINSRTAAGESPPCGLTPKHSPWVRRAQWQGAV